MHKIKYFLIFSFCLFFIGCENPFYRNISGLKRVSFDTVGGTNIESYNTDIIKKSPVTTRDGYFFLGWYETINYEGEAISFPYSPKNNVTLYAKWVKLYKVTYETDGGLEINDENVYEILISPFTKKENFIFDGWYDNKDFSNNQINFPCLIEKDVTLYAKWIPNFKIVFNTNGGTELNDFSGGIINEEPQASKTGFNFLGWYFDKEFTQKVTFPYICDENRTLYASFEIKQLNIQYDTDIGNNLDSIIKPYGYTLTSDDLPKLEDEDYNFIGWFINGDKISVGYNIISDTVLTAKWEEKNKKKIYQIKYELNNGVFLDNVISTYEENSQTLSLPIPMKQGETFDGWYEKSDLSGSEITQITTGTNKNLTLYAKWNKPKQLDILLSNGYIVQEKYFDPLKMNPSAVIYNLSNKGLEYTFNAVGLLNSGETQLQWCTQDAYPYNYSIKEIEAFLDFNVSNYSGVNYYSVYTIVKKSGKDNWFIICDADPEHTTNPELYYPAFNYLLNYSIVLPSGMEWYIPSISELVPLLYDIDSVNEVLLKLGGDILKDKYWTSNQLTQITTDANGYPKNDNNYYYAISYEKNGYNTNWDTYKMTNKYSVCVITSFVITYDN